MISALVFFFWLLLFDDVEDASWLEGDDEKSRARRPPESLLLFVEDFCTGAGADFGGT